MRLSARAAALAGSALFIPLAIALIASVLMGLGPARGADHKDSPGTTADPAADITDVYAFRSPENADNLVVILNVNPLTAPADNLTHNFSKDVTYYIHVDTNGDLQDNATVSVNFSSDLQKFTVKGLGADITGDVTPPSADATPPAPKITTSGGIKVFAGQRDDPFFFDLVAYKKFVAGPYVPAAGLRKAEDGAPADTFAGTNISSIVIELPITAVTGAANSNTGVIKAWASTSRGGAQVDRMAIPAINTALMPADQKENFNKGNPATDATMFQATGKTTIDGLRGAVDPVLGAENGGPLGNLTSQQVAGALIPDIVTIDFSKAVQFTNGRRLQDDVINAALGVVLNRGGAAGVSDGVDANDKAFLSTFPYEAAPNQPPPAATATATPKLPATGGLPGADGGSGLDWPFVLAIAAGGLLVCAGAGLIIKRRAVR